MTRDLRTKKMYYKFKRLIDKGYLSRECRICTDKKPVKIFKSWRIIDDLFPWDFVAKTHHLLVPKRHTTYEKLTVLERKELDAIKKNFIGQKYDLIIEVPDRTKSIPGHMHLHLIMLKDRFIKS